MEATTVDRLARMTQAASRLDADTIRAVMERAQRIAPNDDDASDGTDRAVIALGESVDDEGALTLPLAGVVARCVQSATRDRLDREAASHSVSLDVVGVDHPDVTQPHRAVDDGCARYEEIRPTLTPRDRAILDTLARDGLRRLAKDRKSMLREHTDGHLSGVAALQAAVTMERRSLRVGVVAQAVGAPAPRTRAASLALRSAACAAWAHVSLAAGTCRKGESLLGRADRALSYVQTDAAALGRIWADESDLLSRRKSLPASATQRYGFMPVLSVRPVTITRPTVYGPLCKGWERSDDGERITYTQAAGASLAGALPAARKGPARRSRKGQVWANVSPRYAGGVETGQAVGTSVVSGDESETTGAQAARTASRRLAADESVALAHGLRWAALARPCTHPVRDPYASQRWECDPVCACGGATGRTLLSVLAAHPTDPTGSLSWCGTYTR